MGQNNMSRGHGKENVTNESYNLKNYFRLLFNAWVFLYIDFPAIMTILLNFNIFFL